MQIRATVLPGQQGAKKLLTQYGDRLVCVRYRYDEQRQRRLKTVELIVEEEDWQPLRVLPQGDHLVCIRFTLPEAALHTQVKQRGGRWDPEQRLWELRYAQVVALGLAERILDSGGL